MLGIWLAAYCWQSSGKGLAVDAGELLALNVSQGSKIVKALSKKAITSSTASADRGTAKMSD